MFGLQERGKLGIQGREIECMRSVSRVVIACLPTEDVLLHGVDSRQADHSVNLRGKLLSWLTKRSRCGERGVPLTVDLVATHGQRLPYHHTKPMWLPSTIQLFSNGCAV